LIFESSVDDCDSFGDCFKAIIQFCDLKKVGFAVSVLITVMQRNSMHN